MSEDPKKCIWCLREASDTTTFNKRAHTVPQSLGGQNICANVCDECNHYFGNHAQQLPSIEAIIKEAFIIARYRFMNGKDIGKNQAMPRFKSRFFSLGTNPPSLKLKPIFQLRPQFQEQLGRLLRRGVYKMYLEEIERQFEEGHDPRYDFIRDFARYDQGDLPLFYFHRRAGIYLFANEWIKYPHLLLRTEKPMTYLTDTSDFDEFEFLGHPFGVATAPGYAATTLDYLQHSMALKHKYFRAFGNIGKFTDMDVALSILDE
jgi:hypothetical protein